MMKPGIIKKLCLSWIIAVVFVPVQLFCAESGLTITTDRDNHLYSVGEPVTFLINCDRTKSGTASFRISEDRERVLDSGTLELKGGKASIEGRLERPGFLRLDLELIVGDDTLNAVSAAGISPEMIQPTNVMPDDFESFWNYAKSDLERIPVDAQVERRDDPEHPESELYHVSLANIDGTRYYCWLRVPKGDGPFPAVLLVPGAGVGAIGSQPSYAAAGFISLSVEIHGIGIDKPSEYYKELKAGKLKQYYHFGKDNPYNFYYKRVILGALRGLDYLCSRPDVDTSRVAVAGSSQGGALSLIVGGLDNRIKALTANVPAMCDHTGTLYGRPSGWPRLFRDGDRDKVLHTSGYYDAALMAGLIDVPALLAVGFVDPTCAPTSVYAAYNNLKGYKEIDNFPDMDHDYGPGWKEKSIQWLMDALNGEFE